MEGKDTSLWIVAIFGGLPLASLVSVLSGLWVKDQARQAYRETLTAELGAFEGSLLRKLDERFTLAAGSRITGREAENRLLSIEDRARRHHPNRD